MDSSDFEETILRLMASHTSLRSLVIALARYSPNRDEVIATYLAECRSIQALGIFESMSDELLEAFRVADADLTKALQAIGPKK